MLIFLVVNVMWIVKGCLVILLLESERGCGYYCGLFPVKDTICDMRRRRIAAVIYDSAGHKKQCKRDDAMMPMTFRQRRTN